MSDYGSTPPPPPPPGGGGTPPPPPPPPPPSYGAPGAPGVQGTPPPPNYLIWAILTTIFCCLPLGIVSIVFSTQVNNKWALGDVAGAQDSSVKAKKFAIWSAIATGIVVVIWVILLVVGIGSINFNTGTTSF
jgi:hypothetical protein